MRNTRLPRTGGIWASTGADPASLSFVGVMTSSIGDHADPAHAPLPRELIRETAHHNAEADEPDHKQRQDDPTIVALIVAHTPV